MAFGYNSDKTKVEVCSSAEYNSLNSVVSQKANSSDVTTQLNLKANASDVYTKSESGLMLKNTIKRYSKAYSVPTPSISANTTKAIDISTTIPAKSLILGFSSVFIGGDNVVVLKGFDWGTYPGSSTITITLNATNPTSSAKSVDSVLVECTYIENYFN